MIAINSLTKSYGKRILFRDISLNIGRGEKIGLIGPNGAGKSTLFQILRGDIEPTSGAIQFQKNLKIGYLAQESSFSSDKTVLAELTEGDESIRRLVVEKNQLEESHRADEMHYGEILHELDVLGYFELEHRAEKILSGLGFRQKDFHRPITQMSGGWQMRTLLAKLLTYSYDLLLLDEPTNYLDLNAALWLKDFLSGYRGTFIMISHDKSFLNDVTNYTLILENGMVAKVTGNYEHYVKIKEERQIFLERQAKEQDKKRQQLEKFVSRFHAQPNKAAAVRNKRKTLERMEEICLPMDSRPSIRAFKFPQTRPSGQRVITLEKMSKAYGDIQVYRDFDFEIEKGDKAVLVGENGAGKSTLLKILAGVVPMDTGTRSVGHNVELGYFSQTRLDTLNASNTVLQEAYAVTPWTMSQETIRTILGAFLFSGEDVEKRVSVLSGGEKSRLNLAKFLIDPPNFLLLDEPTTHLDVDAVDALIAALSGYEGTLVFISHDIHFVRSVANVVYEVKEGCVRKFYGGFDYYLEKRSQSELEQRAFNAHNRKSEHQKRESSQDAERDIERKRKEAERQRKAHNTAIGQKISQLRQQQDSLKLESSAKARALADQRTYQDEDKARNYGRRLKEIEKELQGLSHQIEQWESKLQN